MTCFHLYDILERQNSRDKDEIATKFSSDGEKGIIQMGLEAISLVRWGCFIF